MPVLLLHQAARPGARPICSNLHLGLHTGTFLSYALGLFFAAFSGTYTVKADCTGTSTYPGNGFEYKYDLFIKLRLYPKTARLSNTWAQAS
jgi:hypothetical protein